METDTALVGTNGVVVLDTVTHVGLNLTLVIHPCYTELVNSVGDTEALNQINLVKLRVLVVLFFNGTKNLFYCLMILRFVGEASFQVFQYFFCVHSEMFLTYDFTFVCNCVCKITHFLLICKRFVRKSVEIYSNRYYYPS